jgi:protein involved in polysaccharide export with SLBB domain
LTTAELEAVLKVRTSDRLRDPEVVVSIARYNDKSIYVGGEVWKPGMLPYRKGLTPLQAVSAAGGFRDTARVDSVVLVRNGAGDDFIARKLNLKEVVNEGQPEPIILAPHDVIFVPRSAVADANVWVRQWLTDMIPFFRGYTIPISPLVF